MLWKQFVVIKVHEFSYWVRYKIWEGVRCLSAGKILPEMPD